MVTKVKPFGANDIVKKGGCTNEEFILENATFINYPEKGKLIITLTINGKVAATVPMKIFGSITSPYDRWQTVAMGKKIIAEYFLANVDKWNISIRDKAILSVLVLNVILWSKFSSRRCKNSRVAPEEQRLRNDLREKVKLYRDTLLPKETN